MSHSHDTPVPDDAPVGVEPLEEGDVVLVEDSADGEPPVPARQPELDLGLVPTGDARVDDALALLEQVADRPVDDHPEVFEHVHHRLSKALADEAPDDVSAEPAESDG